MSFIHKNQKGFTLIELLVALPIAALVVAAATTAIIPILQSTNTSAHMVALRQVQTAGYWVSTDSLQAQSVEDGDRTTLHIDADDPATENIEEILILKWTDRDGEVHKVTYKLVGDSGELKQLQREETITGAMTTTTITIVGQNIDDGVDCDTDKRTTCDWTSDKKEAFTFKVTATVTGARGPQIETRTYEIQPRPDQIP